MPHDAIKYASRSIELNPLFHDVYWDRAFEYRHIEDKENSLRTMRLCLSINSEAMQCKVFLAYDLLWINDLQNIDKHLTDLELRINTEKLPRTTMPAIYLQTRAQRAICFAKLGKKDQALANTKNLWRIPKLQTYAELEMAHEVVQSIKEKLNVNKEYNASLNYYDLSQSPFFECIRNDPEFQNLIAQQKPNYDKAIRKYRIK